MKLIVENLTKNYGEKEVLKNIDFIFENGKIYGLLGRNGVGKTTFFNCLNKDIEFQSGIFYLEEKEKKELTQNEIGYVLSNPVVPDFLTGREFLKFYLDINKDKIRDIKDIDYYFDLVKISKKDQDILLKEYSHGMKNKIQILINIISNPKVILLDEPLVSLDVIVQDNIKKLLKNLKKDHIVIFSTHILELALDLCDDIVLLKDKNFEEVKKSNLGTKKYKDKILKILKEEENV